MKKPPTLADTIVAKLDAGRLPREDHTKRWVGDGQNRPCVACEHVILHSQVQHGLELRTAGLSPCTSAVPASTRPSDGTAAGPARARGPTTAAIITAALIVERPLCLDCIAVKAGVGTATAEVTLARIRSALILQRDEPGRCRDCGSIGVVFSLDES
jgi:hypothetical protein